MQQLDLFTGETKEDKTLTFLREHEPPEGYFLGFSGGKDSVVLKHLADLSGVKYQAYYSATGIDAPELVKFIREHHHDVIFKRPHLKMPRRFPDWEGTHSFFGMIPKRGFPTKFSRWCCDELKKKPTNDVPLNHRLMGIRAEESAKRAKRGQIDTFRKWTIYKPIFSWLEWEVWEFIERHSLPYCSLYDEGFGRLGCVICPFLCRPNQGAINQCRNKWPKFYAAFEKSMKRLWDEKEQYRQKKKGDANTFDKFLSNWYRGN